MIELRIECYSQEKKKLWDDFVMYHSINGTFLQTKNFLDYHGDKFEDASLMIYKGTNSVVAVLPACILSDGKRKIFSSHQGSTFGGIIVSKEFNNIEHIVAVMDIFEQYWEQKKYDEVILKCTADIFCSENANLIPYLLYQRGYKEYLELSSYIDFQNYKEDVLSNLTSGRRRDYKYALKNNLMFQKIDADEEIIKFYNILCASLSKHGITPVHTKEELLEFKNERLRDVVEFYGVYYWGQMIAGSMVFNFSDNVFHTQYLAADAQYLKCYPMNFLCTNLIELAMKRKFGIFSFGISTEQKGQIFNKNLAQFKEGFGTICGLNRTYIKKRNENTY